MKKDLEIIKNIESKILDLAGDFLLSGYRIIGKVFCYQGGHELTNLFLKKVLRQKQLFKLKSQKILKLRKNFITKS